MLSCQVSLGSTQSVLCFSCAGILQTGSPQEPRTLACRPHSPNCLPALMTPSNLSCLRVDLKTLSCLAHFLTLGKVSLCPQKADSNSTTPCSKPSEITRYWEGTLGAMRPGNRVCPHGARSKQGVQFTSLLLISRCCYCYFKL